MSDDNFITRLKMILEDKQMSQKELASKIDTTEVSISRYLSGDRQPKFFVIEKIADVLNVTTDYLLGRTDVKNIMDTPIQIAASTKNGLDLSEICEEDKQTIMNIYQMMKDKNKKD